MPDLQGRIERWLSDGVEGEASPASWPACVAIVIGAAAILLAISEAAGWIDLI